MKILLTLFVLLFCNVAYAEWYKLSADKNFDHYIEKESIKKVDGFVYYWEMIDLKERTQGKDLSIQVYKWVDCTLIRFKTLIYIFYDNNMGMGAAEIQESEIKDWKYDPPDSIGGYAMNYACK